MVGQLRPYRGRQGVSRICGRFVYGAIAVFLGFQGMKSNTAWAQEAASEVAPASAAPSTTPEPTASTDPSPDSNAPAPASNAAETSAPTTASEPPATTAPASTASPEESTEGANTAAANSASGEDSKAASEAAGANPMSGAEWQTQFTAWKSLLKELRDLRTEYNIAEDSELAGLQEKWAQKIAEANAMIPLLETAAVSGFKTSPGSDKDLTAFLLSLAGEHIQKDDYPGAMLICQGLIDGKCTEPTLSNLAGIAAFGTNQFDLAEKFLGAAQKAGTLNDESSAMISSVADCKKLWEAEQLLREKEGTANDLPRVELKTSVGTFVLELFENEAPETVGNFVNLVEKGFYDGLTFHRVLHGFMAQGGCPKGDGSGGPGYSIYCECYNENHRNHFAGSLSMAKETARNTGGSQFFLNFVATPHLNGRHTVFGRIIEGMEHLPQITKIEATPRGGPEPTKIIEAKVVRKRAHDYVPKKVD